MENLPFLFDFSAQASTLGVIDLNKREKFLYSCNRLFATKFLRLPKMEEGFMEFHELSRKNEKTVVGKSSAVKVGDEIS